MPVEHLKEEDSDQFLALAEESHRNSAWGDYPFDRSVAEKNLQSMLANPNCFVCVYRNENGIVGYFLAFLGTFLFGENLFGMESGIYVKPAHRGGRAALLMFNQFQAWCLEKKAEPFVEIYYAQDEQNEKTYEFFRKAGMIECGRIFRSNKNGMH